MIDERILKEILQCKAKRLWDRERHLQMWDGYVKSEQARFHVHGSEEERGGGGG